MPQRNLERITYFYRTEPAPGRAVSSHPVQPMDIVDIMARAEELAQMPEKMANALNRMYAIISDGPDFNELPVERTRWRKHITGFPYTYNTALQQRETDPYQRHETYSIDALEKTGWSGFYMLTRQEGGEGYAKTSIFLPRVGIVVEGGKPKQLVYLWRHHRGERNLEKRYCDVPESIEQLCNLIEDNQLSENSISDPQSNSSHNSLYTQALLIDLSGSTYAPGSLTIMSSVDHNFEHYLAQKRDGVDLAIPTVMNVLTSEVTYRFSEKEDGFVFPTFVHGDTRRRLGKTVFSKLQLMQVMQDLTALFPVAPAVISEG